MKCVILTPGDFALYLSLSLGKLLRVRSMKFTIIYTKQSSVLKKTRSAVLCANRKVKFNMHARGMT